jgi:hypothetical protein
LDNGHHQSQSTCLKRANIDFCAKRGVPTGYACSPVELGQFSSISFSLAALLNGTLIGDPTCADAILDRIAHNAHRIRE